MTTRDVNLYPPNIFCPEKCGLLIRPNKMKKVNKQCLLDTPRTVRVSEKTWQVTVRTRRRRFQ